MLRTLFIILCFAALPAKAVTVLPSAVTLKTVDVALDGSRFGLNPPGKPLNDVYWGRLDPPQSTGRYRAVFNFTSGLLYDRDVFFAGRCWRCVNGYSVYVQEESSCCFDDLSIR